MTSRTHPESAGSPERRGRLPGGRLALLATSLLAAAVPLGAAEPAPEQFVCPRRSEAVKAPPGPEDLFYNPDCAPAAAEGEERPAGFVPRPQSYIRKCPLRTLDVLPVAEGVAKATVAVAFAEYGELTNFDYQRYTRQLDLNAESEEECDAAKGLWTDSGECLISPRVRVEPATLEQDTKDWCCDNHVDAIWKGQGEGPNKGCLVPSYVFHRGLGADENLAPDSELLKQPARLRSYGFGTAADLGDCLTDPAGCGKLAFDVPARAIVLRKGCAPGQLVERDGETSCDPSLPIEPDSALPNDGDRLELALYNLLPADGVGDQECNPYNRPDPGDRAPNCFHGDDVTNLHFHGSHVSPQAHQDDVLLQLKPLGSQDATGHGPIAFGRTDVALDPITWRQAEGTHWYHPHKHGSTALQVVNGMAGPFIVKGPFDDFIDREVLGVDPADHRSSLAAGDRILVVQAIADEINLSARFLRWNTPWLMVNGQFQPTVRMQPGEVQRWRIIGATQEATASIEIAFEGGDLEVVQIARDGVQLAPESYERLLRNKTWKLAPGNRIDLLVRAKPGAGRRLIRAGHRPSESLPSSARRRSVGDPRSFYPLVYIEICEPGTDDGTGLACAERDLELPATLPPLPEFLRDVADGEIARRRTIYFSQSADPAGAARDGAKEPKEVAKFFIDGRPYDPDCVNHTMELGTAEEWRIVNTSQMPHPLHIHTNPFQVTGVKYLTAASADDLEGVEQKDNVYQLVDECYGPGAAGCSEEAVRIARPIWHDTYALPTAVELGCVPADGTRAPTDPGRCQEGEVPPRLLVGPPGKRKLVDLPVGGVFNGELTLRHRFEDFSGAYVLHCHILGHEDRGMMQNLQTVCPNGMYGRPASYWIDGGGSFLDEAAVPPVRQRECRPDGYKPALPACAAAPHGGPEAPHG